MTLNLRKGSAMELMSMTPLIDCVFLLLIFFLVAARFEQEEKQLKVKLPSASEAKPLTARPEKITLNIAADGSYFVQGKVVTLNQLLGILEAAVRSNPTQSVYFRVDKNCVADKLMAAINACHKANITDYSFGADK